MEAVIAMFHDQDLPMYLWFEAAKTAIYVQNKLSHSALGNKTPEEMFTSEKPKVSHLKIFGCPIYLHVPKEKRSKLGPSRKKGIFIGYNDQLKAYRIYIPGFCKIEVGKDVTFDEDAYLNKSIKNHADEEDPILEYRDMVET